MVHLITALIGAGGFPACDPWYHVSGEISDTMTQFRLYKHTNWAFISTLTGIHSLICSTVIWPDSFCCLLSSVLVLACVVSVSLSFFPVWCGVVWATTVSKEDFLSVCRPICELAQRASTRGSSASRQHPLCRVWGFQHWTYPGDSVVLYIHRRLKDTSEDFVQCCSKPPLHDKY